MYSINFFYFVSKSFCVEQREFRDHISHFSAFEAFRVFSNYLCPSRKERILLN